MINKKIIKALEKYYGVSSNKDNFDLQLFGKSMRDKIEDQYELDREIKKFHETRKNKLLKGNAKKEMDKVLSSGFIQIPAMIEEIQKNYDKASNTYVTNIDNVRKEIRCTPAGVYEEDILPILLAPEHIPVFTDWIENHIIESFFMQKLLRYNVDGKYLLLFVESITNTGKKDKKGNDATEPIDIGDPRQKYISAAKSYLRNNPAKATLELLIKKYTDQENMGLDSLLEEDKARLTLAESRKRSKPLRDFTGKELQEKTPSATQQRTLKKGSFQNQIKDIMILTGADYTEAAEALTKTKNKEAALGLIYAKKRETLLPKADYQKDTPRKLNTAKQDQARKTEQLIVSLAGNYLDFTLQEIRDVLTANQNNIKKTEEELNKLLLIKGSSDLKENYPYVNITDIDQIIKNECSVEAAIKILEIENTIRQNKYILSLKNSRSLIKSVEKAKTELNSIVKKNGLYSKEASDASKILTEAMDDMKSHINPQKWDEDKKRIVEANSYLNKKNLLLKTETNTKIKTKKAYTRDGHGQIVGIKVTGYKE